MNELGDRLGTGVIGISTGNPNDHLEGETMFIEKKTPQVLKGDGVAVNKDVSAVLSRSKLIRLVNEFDVVQKPDANLECSIINKIRNIVMDVWSLMEGMMWLVRMLIEI